ncbi:hypothetical protein KYLE_43 [Pantoea phage Kyle]|uniref:Cyanophage baseplate Pam3 plug gp18 domain-containing protein n=1 Tax=Pantoea phage Kyle TaxID=2589665 RepID=A0A514A8I2_9CAUD|nr:virion structural protein [Pantoea phage Kyle]QDH49590.1 hypothetical protein KYLE_43 [Pantoea phage Kyle]
MYRIPLSKTPNQIVSFNLDGAYWTLYVYSAITHMCCDIERNGETLIRGVRCFGGIPLIPYKHLVGDFGNFYFNDEADWELFDGSVQLNYLNKSEVSQYNSLIESGLYTWQV